MTVNEILPFRYRIIKNLRRSLHGQTRAKGQSGSQEAQKGEDQDNCCRSKSKDRHMAADNRLRQKEIARHRRRALDRATAEATPGRLLMSVGKVSAASISTEAPLDNHCACTDQPQKDWQQYGGYEPFAEIEFLGIGHMTACSVEAGHAAGILKISLGQRPGARVSRCFSIAFTKWVQHSRHIPLIRALT